MVTIANLPPEVSQQWAARQAGQAPDVRPLEDDRSVKIVAQGPIDAFQKLMGARPQRPIPIEIPPDDCSRIAIQGGGPVSGESVEAEKVRAAAEVCLQHRSNDREADGRRQELLGA